jgi:hypothetical protein
MPPKTGEHYAEKMELDGHAGDQKTPVPLKINFIPNLPKTAYQKDNVHFELSAKDYEVKIEGTLKFVKGWAGEVVKLGTAVPAGTGGLLDGKLSWNGYRWMKIINKTRKYWNGSAWTDLPTGFLLKDINNFAVGFYKNGTKFTCQYSGDWPEPFPDWNIDAQASKDKIKKWQDNINTTWTGKFRLKREQCKSHNNKCCSYTTKADVKFSKQTSFSSGMLIIADGNIRSNDSLFFLGETRIAMAAHEVGHHLGNPDEYAGATSVDTSLNDDGAVNGIDNDSLMGKDLTKVKKRHYRTICKHLADMVKTKTGNTYSYKAD